MENKENIKNCPFCNGDAVVVVNNLLKIPMCQVECFNLGCYCCGPVKKTIQEAIDAWNERYEDKFKEMCARIEKELNDKLVNIDPKYNNIISKHLKDLLG